MAAGAQIEGSRGARAVVGALEDLGVDIAFGLPGVHNLPLWRELGAAPIRLVGVRHEQTAAYAADGYSRASGRLGVALVTTGPGAANTLAAVGEACASHSPVLVIATDVPAALRRPGVVRGLLHESRDQAALFVPLAKAAIEVGSADEIPATVEHAGRLALAAPAGPVYVGIPADLLDASVSASASHAGLLDASVPGDQVMPGARVKEAAALLAGAQRPLIWAGGGAVHSGAGPLLAALAERLAAPVITTYQGRGLLPPEHPCAVPGPVHVPEVGALWDEADVVLAVGSDLDGIMTQNWRMPRPPCLIALNVDAADASKNWDPDVMIHADARAGLEALLDALGERPEGDVGALGRRLAVVADAVRERIARDEPQAAVLLAALRSGLPDETVVVADMCIPGYWAAGFHRVPAPRRLAYPVGWGTLGFAFPAALGSALAHGGPTLCICGDGGFLMACGDLATAAQEGIALTILLVDDGGYGMLRYDQERAEAPSFGVDLATPDFVALASSFGIAAERVTLDVLGEALAASITRSEPAMLVLEAALRPPPTTSPRWYRAAENA